MSSSPQPPRSTADEIERKYAATAGQTLPDLSTVSGVASIDSDVVELSAQYFDTADLALLRARITVRRREGGDDAGWHVKLPTGTDTRTELHVPLTDDDSVPPSLLRLLRSVVRDEPVALAALVSTTRARQRLRDADGALLAEVVVDDVTAVRGADDTELHWREIEVELATGDIALLDAVEDRLAAAGITRSPSPSKLHRVLGDLIPPAPRVKGAAGYLREYLDHERHVLALADIAVRRDAVDAVHSMRKAARRLRSAVQTYSHDLNLDTALVGELRWLGQRLSPARDLEVQHERLTGRVAELPVVAFREATRARIDEYFTAKASAARVEAIDTLDSGRYLELLRSLDALIDGLAEPDGREQGGHRPKPAELTRSAETVAGKVAKRVAKVSRTDDPVERDERMHRARKGAKRLRYAIEVISPLHPKRTARALDRFDEFQDLLGEFQDSVVARDHLVDMASEQGHAAESSFGLGILHRIEAEIGEQQAHRVEGAWQRAHRAARRLWT